MLNKTYFIMLTITNLYYLVYKLYVYVLMVKTKDIT